MVAQHTIEQFARDAARPGYAEEIAPAIARRTATHVLLRMEHPAFQKWHGHIPTARPKLEKVIVSPRDPLAWNHQRLIRSLERAGIAPEDAWRLDSCGTPGCGCAL